MMVDDPEIDRTELEMGEAAGRAYHEIRSRIMNGVLKPGASLPERELCVSVGVSRTPVREALRRLHAEGLVTLKANRTAFVTHLDAAEIEEIFTIGMLLGGYAGRLAAERATNEQLEGLRGQVDELERALARGDADLRDTFGRVGRNFDFLLRQATASPRLQRLLGLTIGAPILPLLLGNLPRSQFEHVAGLQRRIWEALSARDGDAAAAAMTAYAEAGRASALATLDGLDRAAV